LHAFSGSTNGGVLNYVLHFDSLIVNNYSILNTNINNGTFTDLFPACESYFISAVYGFDNNFDGVIDDLFDPCNYIFTSNPIEFYFPIQIFFPIIYSESCFNNETTIQYFINGGITDCLGNNVCDASYTVNSTSNICANDLTTFTDPITGDSIYDITSSDTLFFDIMDTDGNLVEIFKITTDNIVYICPIELIDFKAALNENAVALNWQTASELNNDFFSLYKSIDGKDFERIGIIEGSGTSSKINSYEYHDVNLNAPTIYYKLFEVESWFLKKPIGQI